MCNLKCFKVVAGVSKGFSITGARSRITNQIWVLLKVLVLLGLVGLGSSEFALADNEIQTSGTGESDPSDEPRSGGCEAISSRCLVIENQFRDHLIGVSEQTQAPFEQTYQCLLGSVEAGPECEQINSAALNLLNEYRAAVEVINRRAAWNAIEQLDRTMNGMGSRCFVSSEGEIAFDGNFFLPRVQNEDINGCGDLLTSAEMDEHIGNIVSAGSAPGISEAHFQAIQAFRNSPISGVISRSVLDNTEVSEEDKLDALKRAFHRLSVDAGRIQTYLRELEDPELYQVYIFENQFSQFSEGLEGHNSSLASQCQSCSNVFNDCNLNERPEGAPQINGVVGLATRASMTFGEALAGQRGERCQARANRLARDLFPITAVIDSGHALQRVGDATAAGIMTRSEARLETAMQYLNIAFGVAEVPGYSHLAEAGLRGLAQVARTGFRGGTVATPNALLPDGLLAHTEPFTNAQVPGGMAGLSDVGLTEGRFLRSLDISSTDLPYNQAFRSPREPVRYTGIEEVPRVEVTETDVVLASGEHSGSASVVRLATLPDGRPVAIKQITVDESVLAMPGNENFIADATFREAQGLEIADALGVGPRFHGVYVDDAGRSHLVMDVATGDFPSQSGRNINLQTFEDFEEMFSRIRTSGQGNNLGDFQYFVTDTGNLRVIDAGNFSFSPPTHPAITRQFPDDVMRYRLELIRHADPAVGRAYLERLRRTNQRVYVTTLDRIAMWNHDQLRHLYTAYEDLLIEAGAI